MTKHDPVPKSAGKRKRRGPQITNFERAPLELYNRLDDEEKAIVFFYKINYDCGNNSVGFCWKHAGSSAHWRHFKQIQAYFPSNEGFRSRAKNLKNVSKALHDHKIPIPQPKVNGRELVVNDKLLVDGVRFATPEEVQQFLLSPPGCQGKQV